MSKTAADKAIEAVARTLAMLKPDEEWPTNEALGGSLTGTRDDEFRSEMFEQARDVLKAAMPHIVPAIEVEVRERIARDIEDERDRSRGYGASSPGDDAARHDALNAAARIARGGAA